MTSGATYCPQCGRVFDNNAKTCPACSIGLSGASQELRQRALGDWICKACGARGVGNAAACARCGKSLSSEAGSDGPDEMFPPFPPLPTWQCSKCGAGQILAVDKCSVCGEPRPTSAGGAAVASGRQGSVVCNRCGSIYPDGTTSCTRCVTGQHLTRLSPQGYTYCPKCGREYSDGTANCWYCPAGDGVTHSTKGGRSMPIPISERRLDGLLFEPRPSAAPLYRPPLGAVPDQVNLRQYFTSVEDQGRTSSCAANAVVGALEYHRVRMGGANPDLSRLFIYWNARRMAEKEGDDCGCTMPLVMAATLGYGACKESSWPFDESQVITRPPKECYREAEEHEALTFARVAPGDGVRAAVANGFPVVFGVFFPDRFYQEAASTGVIPLPAEQIEQPAGGHAMLIVGYDHPAQQWIVRNSWGADWGDKGYVRIPYKSLEVYSPPDCYWVIGAIEQAQGQLMGASLKDTLKDIEKSAKSVMNEAIGRLNVQRRTRAASPQVSAYGNYIYECNDCHKGISAAENNIERCPYCGGRVTYIGPGSARGGSAFQTGRAMSTPAAVRGYKGAPLPVSLRRLDGCLFENRRSNAPVLQTPMGSAPNAVDLREHCSPVEDQGQTNSCTANATVGAMEYHQRRSGGAFVDISRLFVYYNSRQLAGAQAEDCGSFIHHSMAAVLAHGACEENVWPFDLSQVKIQPPQAAYQNGGQYEAVQYARTLLGNPVLQAVAAGLPIVFGTYIPGRFYDEAGQTGLMPAPAERLEPPGNGHAMLIVGYDLPSKTWLVRNSWGERWADKGYFRVPFATVEAYSYPDHFWAIGAIEGKQGLSLSGPSPMQAAQAVRAEAAGELREALNKLRGDLRSDFQAELDKQKADIRNRLRNPDKT